MEPGTTQWGCEVIEDDGLGTPLRLAALARIVDDEGIEMGHRAQGPLRKTAVSEPHPLAGQPFEVAVLAHMHDRMGSEVFPEPEVLG